MIHRTPFPPSIFACVSAALILIATPSAAQAEESSAVIEEIVVTAQRREENLREVPISLTVIGSEQIERAAMRGTRDLFQRVANVTFTENDAQGTRNGDISIRGLSDLTSGGNERIIQSRPAIGFNVDEFSISSVASGSANPPLDDIERIEILRGPQGTYFGRNATGGAINVVTRKPDNSTMAKVRVGYGSFNTQSLGVIGNVPIEDNLFVRAGIAWEKSDGVVENLSPTGNDADNAGVNARVAVRWQPDRWTIDLSAQIVQEDQGNLGKIPTGISPAGFLGGGPGASGADDLGSTCGRGADLFFQNGNDQYNCEDQDTYQKYDNRLYMLRAEYAADRFTLTSITGGFNTDFEQHEDIDNSGWNIFNRTNNYSATSFSQEVRLNSNSDDWIIGDRPVQWMLGALVYEDEFDVDNRISAGSNVAPGFVGFLTVPGDYPNENEQNVERDGWAAFFDVSFDITDDLRLSLSGRYSEDNDLQYWRNTYATFVCGTRAVVDGAEAPLAQGCELRPDHTDPLPITRDGDGNMYVTGGRLAQRLFTDGENDSSDFSPRIALNWTASEDHNLYFTYSRGYRAAGVRTAPDSDDLGPSAQLGLDLAPDTRSFFDKEQVSNYEVGWKGSFNQGRSYAELAVFWMVWEDMQVRLSRFVCALASGELVEVSSSQGTQCVGGPQPDNRVDNAKEAEVKGFEFSVQSLVGDRVQVGGFAGYSNGEFTDFPNSAFGDVGGQKLPYAPELTAGINAEVSWPVASGELYVRGELLYRDGFITQFGFLDRSGFPFEAEDVTLVNLQAGIDWGAHNLNLSVDNLLGEDYTLGAETFSQTGAVVVPHPTFVRLTWTASIGE